MTSEGAVDEMTANMSTGRSSGTASRTGAGTGRVPARGSSSVRRVGIVVGLIFLPLGAIILAGAPLLQAGGWTGATLVVGGASVLAVGIALVSAPAHAEHLRSRGGARRDGEDDPANGSSTGS